MENLEEIRNDKQFLANLADQEKRALFNQDIIELYEVLDMILLLNLDENRLEEIYLNILKIAFEDLKERLELNKMYKIENTKDTLLMRAIYERGIECWSYDDTSMAKEIFLILLSMTNNQKLKKSFSIHFLALLKDTNIDDFYEKFVNRDDNITKDEFTNYDYFLVDFKPLCDTLLDDGTEELKKALNNFNPKTYSLIL